MTSPRPEEKLAKILLVLRSVGRLFDGYDPEKEFKHIESTRKTRKAALAEVELLQKGHKKQITRFNKVFDLIEQIAVHDKGLQAIDSLVKEIEQ